MKNGDTDFNEEGAQPACAAPRFSATTGNCN
jgi:hypothetical protein